MNKIKDLSHLSEDEFEKAMCEGEGENELSESELLAMAERSRVKVMDALPEIFGKQESDFWTDEEKIEFQDFLDSPLSDEDKQLIDESLKIEAQFCQGER